MKLSPKVITPMTCELITFPADSIMPEKGVTQQSGLQLIYLIEGEVETTTDEGIYRVVKGDLAVIDPGENHHSRAIADSVILSMLYSH